MNSAFVGQKEICRSRRVLSSVDNTLLDLHNSSYPTQPRSLIGKSFTSCAYFFLRESAFRPHEQICSLTPHPLF